MKKFPKPWFRPSRKTWYVTLDGQQFNLGQDKQQAFERYKQLVSRPRPKAAASYSLAAIIDAFLEWSQKHRSPDTYEWYRYRLQRFIERYPDLLVSDLRPYHVQVWVDSYPDFSKTTRRNYTRSVKRCLNWALQQGYIDHNPVAHLEVPGAERRETIITSEEFETLLSFIPDDSLRDPVIVTWETGCRPQESLRVEARHIDLENQRWVFPQNESKGKQAPRVVYLTDTAMAITRRLMLKYPTGPLFRNVNGKAWSADTVNCGFDRIRIRMGKKEMRRRGVSVPEEDITAKIDLLRKTKRTRGKTVQKTPAELRYEAKVKVTNKIAAKLASRCSLYVLRHSWATHALQRGIDPLTVAILMGHKDPSMLARVYQHLSHNPKHLLEQAKRAAG
jgi:integrase